MKLRKILSFSLLFIALAICMATPIFAGEALSFKAMMGTALAHVDGGVPNIMVEIEKVDAYNVGYLLYFMMFSCGVACYMQKINPFNQPGVESYKKNMFALLGKPGFEELAEQLKKRF